MYDKLIKIKRMNLNDLKIDDDLVEYLSTKPNLNEFVNQCIRDAKAKEPEVHVHEEIVSENKGEQPPVPPVNDQFIKFALIIIGIIIFISFLFTMIHSCGNSPQNNNTNDDSAMVLGNDSDTQIVDSIDHNTTTPSSSGSSWNFEFDHDKMDNSKRIYARITSDNVVGLDYSSTDATICVRYMKKYGYEALITLSSGQIFGNEYNGDNYILVKFDDGHAKKYYFDETSDGSSETVFIRKKSDFIAHCKKSKKIRIEIPIFDNGRQVFDFKVDKPLTWRTK